MANNKITQEEAERLLNMIKKTLSNSINFPGKGEEIEFELSGDTKKELFITKIYRGRINHKKYERFQKVQSLCMFQRFCTLICRLHIRLFL